MARLGVLCTGVGQADNQFNRDVVVPEWAIFSAASLRRGSAVDQN